MHAKKNWQWIRLIVFLVIGGILLLAGLLFIPQSSSFQQAQLVPVGVISQKEANFQIDPTANPRPGVEMALVWDAVKDRNPNISSIEIAQRKTTLNNLLLTPVPTVTPAGNACTGIHTIFAESDTWIDSEQPDATFGQNPTFTLRQSETGSQRMLIFFPIADELSPFTPIISAQLELSVESQAGSLPATPMRFFNVATRFDEQSVTWNTQPASDTPYAIAPSVNGTRYQWDITATVRDWLSQRFVNHGLLIALPIDSTFEAIFTSREGATDDSTRPKLTIDCGAGLPQAIAMVAETATPLPQPTATPAPPTPAPPTATRPAPTVTRPVPQATAIVPTVAPTIAPTIPVAAPTVAPAAPTQPAATVPAAPTQPAATHTPLPSPVTFTPTPANTPVPTATFTPVPPTATFTPTSTATFTPTPTATFTPTPTATFTPTPTATFTPTPTATFTPTPTATFTPTPTATFTPTPTPPPSVIADLVISKSDNPDPVAVGQPLTYTLTITNLGPSTATNVVVTDTLPTNVTIGSVSASQGNCSIVGQTVVCNLGDATPVYTALVSSTFTTDDDGWTLTSGAVSSPTPNYSATGGNPDGHIWADDDAFSGVYYYIAPEKFRGDKSAAYGGNLKFDLRAQASFSSPYDADHIQLISGGTTLTRAITLPTSTWASYSLRLDENSGWVNTATGQPPTQAEMRSVLSNLTDLYILGEYYHYNDQSYLDNVMLMPGPAFVTVVVTPTVGGTLVNTATVSANTTDPNLANNTATETTTVTTCSAPNPDFVTSTTPAEDATGIPITTTITVLFNQTMNAATLNTNNVQLCTNAACNSNGIVATTLQITDTNVAADTVLLTPQNLLDTDRTYHIKVRAEVENACGTPQNIEYNTSFQTEN